MWLIVKREWLSMWPYILFVFGFLSIIYLLQWEPPNGFLLTYLLFFLLASLFYSDKKSKANRYFLSLPVKRNEIVLGRYLFIVGIGHLLTLFVWIFDIFFPLGERLSGENFIMMIMVMNFIIAYSIPIYYAINEIWLAIIVQVIVLIGGSFIFVYITVDPVGLVNLLIEKVFHSVPLMNEIVDFIININLIIYIIIVPIVMLTISLIISQAIFARKDIQ